MRAETQAEFRLARAEVGDLRREMGVNFRWLLGLYIAGFGTLLGIIAHGFKWL